MDLDADVVAAAQRVLPTHLSLLLYGHLADDGTVYVAAGINPTWYATATDAQRLDLCAYRWTVRVTADKVASVMKDADLAGTTMIGQPPGAAPRLPSSLR
ncbi:hypothetical protein HH308_06260 [Gordonia sp. TBRC 11910]|uniref:Uncharacterized protein n=1 Tax=Gordonia asplenii TaxID=2725283 RepID=A0A848KVC5_9ACTN|nr:hypothetical protein [Gordonia asplenii]NMO00815.1 hypothetical protein [Gordonia asplenii]